MDWAALLHSLSTLGSGCGVQVGLLRGEVVSEALCGARQRLAREQPRGPTPHLYLLSGYPDLRF